MIKSVEKGSGRKELGRLHIGHWKRLVSQISKFLLTPPLSIDFASDPFASGSADRTIFDVKLVCRDGVVHWSRFLLAANSSFLKTALLEASFVGDILTEQEPWATVLLPDMSVSTVGSMLKCTINPAVRNDTLSVNELEVMKLLGFKLLYNSDGQVQDEDKDLEDIDRISLLSDSLSTAGSKEVRDERSNKDEDERRSCDDDYRESVINTPIVSIVDGREEIMEDGIKSEDTTVKLDFKKTKNEKNENKGWICPERTCQMKFNRRENLQRHQVSHDPDKSLACEQCGKFFKHPHNLYLHMKYHEDLNVELECDRCGVRVMGKRGLTSHVESAHSTPVNCTVCGKSISSKRLLNRHMARVHPNNNAEEISGMVYCHICKKGFKNAHSLMLHKRSHDEDNPFLHPLPKSVKKPYVRCQTCDKLFASERHLLLHQRRTHMALVKDCLKCDKKVKNLRKHDLACHSSKPEEKSKNVESVQCEKCQSTFSSKYTLQAHHMRVHEDQKAHKKCSICDKYFVTNSGLNRHTREVHGENSFECDECGLFFPVRHSLERHLRNVHNPVRLKCPECDLSVLHISAHLVTIHKYEKENARMKTMEMSGNSSARTNVTLDLVVKLRSLKEDKSKSQEETGPE